MSPAYGGTVHPPTVVEFVYRCESEYDCTLGTVQLSGPRGDDSGQYLIRDMEDGSVRFAGLPDIPEGSRISVLKLRSLLALLEIEHTDFGFPEDYPEIPED